jgi:metallo-beta-lactamase class B
MVSLKKTIRLVQAGTFVFLFLFFSAPVYAQAKGANLKITRLTGNFYVYTTYSTYENNRLPANGMYLVTNSGVVLFDTPWDTTQFQPLLDSIKLKHGKHVTLCIATHWHSDRTAGLEYYKQQGIKTYTTVRTDQLSKQNQKKRAEFLIEKDTVFHIAQYAFETYFPGEGHTADNIIIWFKKEKILYGGCLIKGADAEDLGYLGDANVTEYATTLQRVQNKCPKPAYIVVSHSGWNNKNSLSHSLQLAKKLRLKN